MNNINDFNFINNFYHTTTYIRTYIIYIYYIKFKKYKWEFLHFLDGYVLEILKFFGMYKRI